MRNQKKSLRLKELCAATSYVHTIPPPSVPLCQSTSDVRSGSPASFRSNSIWPNALPWRGSERGKNGGGRKLNKKTWLSLYVSPFGAASLVYCKCVNRHVPCVCKCVRACVSFRCAVDSKEAFTGGSERGMERKGRVRVCVSPGGHCVETPPLPHPMNSAGQSWGHGSQEECI